MNSKNLRFAKQRGQSIAEFVTVIGVFFTMMLCISYVAKMGNLSQNMRESVRHTAWLETAATPNALIGQVHELIR